jgi:hypothetical protein
MLENRQSVWRRGKGVECGENLRKRISTKCVIADQKKKKGAPVPREESRNWSLSIKELVVEECSNNLPD